MLSRLPFIALLCILIAFTAHSSETQPWTHGEWQKYDQDDVAMFFFDKSSVKRTGPNEILVWDYQVLSRKFAEELGKALPEMSGRAYLFTQTKIDCKGNRYSQLRIIWLNKERQVVYDSKRDSKDMSPLANRPIPKDSPIDNLSNIMCKISK